MFKLILDPDKTQEKLSFNKESIFIGNFSEDADLYLPNETLSSSKLEIQKSEDSFVLINCANDPFSSLNGLPFSKKTLQHEDQIEIGCTKIIFLIEQNEPEPPPEINQLFELVENLEVEKKKKKETIKPLPIKAPIVKTEEETSIPHPNPEPKPEPKPAKEPEPTPKKRSGFKILVVTTFFILLLSSIGVGAAYLRLRGKAFEEVKIAAGAIADATMALTHAKIYNIKPKKQYWSSPEFLYHNLRSVLSTKYTPILKINAQRQILDTSYLLRIYTTNNQSRFLIIAQPAHNFSFWGIPKPAIVVDTEGMVLRKIEDLRALNRLLANPNPLDGRNGENVFALIKDGEPISLASLASRKSNRGFAPPKALAMIRPGAENLIYNAPRYSPLGEAVIHRVLSLYETPGTETDVALLQNHITSLKKFPDLVYYSTVGMQHAIAAEKALRTFIPKKKFLVAYIKYNTHGREVSSNLLMTDSTIQLKPLEIKPEVNESETQKSERKNMMQKLTFPHPSATLSEEIGKDNEEVASAPPKKESVKRDESLTNTHPLFLRLIELKKRRIEALNEPSQALHALLSTHDETISPRFSLQFRQELKKYETIDAKMQKEILNEIRELYHDYSDVPLKQMMTFIDQAGLGQLIDSSLRKKQLALSNPTDKSDEIKSHIEKISGAKYLEELEHHVNTLSELLVVDNLPLPDQLIAFQNQVRIEVEAKLEAFLLHPNTKLPKEAFHSESAAIITNILHKAWIFDPDEFEFYLNEFEHLHRLYGM